MQLDNKIVRVKEDQVKQKVSEGWKFVPKSVWKEKVRDIEKPTEEKPTKTKNNKMSKSAKRHLRKQTKK
tara:strand:+ start:254 stop:460 length:207 start_codon:yes stop_codon:yes gene_type:complete